MLYLHDVDNQSVTKVGSTRQPGDFSHADIRFRAVKERVSVEGTDGKVFVDTNYYIKGKRDHLLYVHDADKKDWTKAGSTRHPGNLSHSVFKIHGVGNGEYEIRGKNGHHLYVHDADRKDWTVVGSTRHPSNSSHQRFTIRKNHNSNTYRIYGTNGHMVYVHDADSKDWT